MSDENFAQWFSCSHTSFQRTRYDQELSYTYENVNFDYNIIMAIPDHNKHNNTINKNNINNETVSIIERYL